jgi:hypothetical protein
MISRKAGKAANAKKVCLFKKLFSSLMSLKCQVVSAPLRGAMSVNKAGLIKIELHAKRNSRTGIER